MTASAFSTNKRIARMILLFVLLGSVTIPAKADPAAITFVVNTWQDSHDSNTGDGVCNNGAGSCSLRAAIEQANVSSSSSNPVTIHFDDTSWAGLPITLNMGTMQITNSDITIDGESHTIMVDGTVNGANQDIFEISSGYITIRNLTIQNSSHRGIVLLAYPAAGVAHDILIEGVKLVGNDDSAIFMESDIHIPVFSITIQNSLIGTTNASNTACITSPSDQRNGSGIYIINNVRGCDHRYGECGVQHSHGDLSHGHHLQSVEHDHTEQPDWHEWQQRDGKCGWRYFNLQHDWHPDPKQCDIRQQPGRYLDFL